MQANQLEELQKLIEKKSNVNAAIQHDGGDNIKSITVGATNFSKNEHTTNDDDLERISSNHSIVELNNFNNINKKQLTVKTERSINVMRIESD